MNRHFAPALTIATTVIAAIGAAALVSTKAHADDITIDPTPFVSTRTRAEVKAEVTAEPQRVRDGASEWALQHNEPTRLDSGYTRQQALADYKASRQEVSALTAEDSGSSYLMRHAMRMQSGVKVAGAAR
jgi:hypothetical protein